jgi:hypothetical protein
VAVQGFKRDQKVAEAVICGRMPPPSKKYNNPLSLQSPVQVHTDIGCLYKDVAALDRG